MTHHVYRYTPGIQGFVHTREAFYRSSTSLAPKSIIVACDVSLKHLGSAGDPATWLQDHSSLCHFLGQCYGSQRAHLGMTPCPQAGTGPQGSLCLDHELTPLALLAVTWEMRWRKNCTACKGLKKTHLAFITMSEVATFSELDNLLQTQTEQQVLTIWWVTHDF